MWLFWNSQISSYNTPQPEAHNFFVLDMLLYDTVTYLATDAEQRSYCYCYKLLVLHYVLYPNSWDTTNTIIVSFKM